MEFLLKSASDMIAFRKIQCIYLRAKFSYNIATKAKEQLANKGAVVSVIMPQDIGDFNDMLKTKGAKSIKNLIEPEIAKLITNETLNEKTTKFTESLKPINNSELYNVDNNQLQIKSIELGCVIN